MTYIISLHLIPNTGQTDPFSPPMKCSLYMNTNSIPTHMNCIPSPPTFAESVDGNFHAFPWLGDNYLIFESICAWHTPLLYHTWTITRSRMISWLRGNVKAGHLTWCEGQGWEWHTLIIHIWKKMDIRKVKVDHQTILACLPWALSLVSSCEWDAPKICAKHFNNMYFIKFNSKLNDKTFGIKEKQWILWEQRWKIQDVMWCDDDMMMMSINIV